MRRLFLWFFGVISTVIPIISMKFCWHDDFNEDIINETRWTSGVISGDSYINIDISALVLSITSGIGTRYSYLDNNAPDQANDTWLIGGDYISGSMFEDGQEFWVRAETLSGNKYQAGKRYINGTEYLYFEEDGIRPYLEENTDISGTFSIEKFELVKGSDDWTGLSGSTGAINDDNFNSRWIKNPFSNVDVAAVQVSANQLVGSVQNGGNFASRIIQFITQPVTGDFSFSIPYKIIAYPNGITSSFAYIGLHANIGNVFISIRNEIQNNIQIPQDHKFVHEFNPGSVNDSSNTTKFNGIFEIQRISGTVNLIEDGTIRNSQIISGDVQNVNLLFRNRNGAGTIPFSGVFGALSAVDGDGNDLIFKRNVLKYNDTIKYSLGFDDSVVSASQLAAQTSGPSSFNIAWDKFDYMINGEDFCEALFPWSDSFNTGLIYSDDFTGLLDTDRWTLEQDPPNGSVGIINNAMHFQFADNDKYSAPRAFTNAKVNGNFIIQSKFNNLSGFSFDSGGGSSTNAYFQAVLQMNISGNTYSLGAGDIIPANPSQLMGGRGIWARDSGVIINITETIPSGLVENTTFKLERNVESQMINGYVNDSLVYVFTDVPLSESTQMYISYEGRTLSTDDVASVDFTDFLLTDEFGNHIESPNVTRWENVGINRLLSGTLYQSVSAGAGIRESRVINNAPDQNALTWGLSGQFALSGKLYEDGQQFRLETNTSTSAYFAGQKHIGDRNVVFFTDDGIGSNSFIRDNDDISGVFSIERAETITFSDEFNGIGTNSSFIGDTNWANRWINRTTETSAIIVISDNKLSGIVYPSSSTIRAATDLYGLDYAGDFTVSAKYFINSYVTGNTGTPSFNLVLQVGDKFCNIRNEKLNSGQHRLTANLGPISNAIETSFIQSGVLQLERVGSTLTAKNDETIIATVTESGNITFIGLNISTTPADPNSRMDGYWEYLRIVDGNGNDITGKRILGKYNNEIIGAWKDDNNEIMNESLITSTSGSSPLNINWAEFNYNVLDVPYETLSG